MTTNLPSPGSLPRTKGLVRPPHLAVVPDALPSGGQAPVLTAPGGRPAPGGGPPSGAHREDSARAVPSPDAVAVRVQLCFFGRFRFLVDGTAVDDWRSSKSRALFQYLSLHHDRHVPRDTLIAALWANPNAAAPATSLKVAVHSLRATLAASGSRLPFTIVSHEAGYLLQTSGLRIDVEEFDLCYRTGRLLQREGQTAAALAQYARAVELYCGDFLEDSSDEWPVFRRESLKDQYLFIVTELARAAIAEGNYQEGIEHCQRILATDRCREDAYRMLMICHSRLGQRSRVRRWYDLCITTLRSELDCVPSADTESAYQLARAGKA